MRPNKNKRAESNCSIAVILLLFFFVAASPLCAEDPETPGEWIKTSFDDWKINGSNTLRVDYYGNSGDETQATYPFTGLRSYDELNLNFSKSVSKYDTWRGEITGVLNNSPYRSNYYGIVPERLNLTKTKGDSLIPLRLEMGDIFSYYTYRTLQSSLKGVQLDLQPFQNSGSRHSFIITSGARQSSWRNFHLQDSYFNGASYMIDNAKFGKFSLNAVQNSRQADEQQASLSRSQLIYSAAGNAIVKAVNQKLLLEGELSRFTGDHDGWDGPESGQKQSDNGLFFQGSGSSNWPLTYRVRYESYGRDYRPSAASVSPATKNAEGHLGWRLPKGYQMRARAQKTTSNYEMNNPTDTIVYGFNLNGPLGSLDAFGQDISSDDKATDRITGTVSANINIPAIIGWKSRLGCQIQDLSDRIAGGVDVKTRQISFSADRSVHFGSFSGSVTPGILYRQTESPTAKTDELLPTLIVGLKSGPHSLDYNLSWSDLQRPYDGGVDVGTVNQGFNYRYTTERSVLGVEILYGQRDPDPGQKTGSYKLGAYWTFYFDKPAKTTTGRKPKPEEQALVQDSESAIPALVNVDIAALIPGMKIEKAVELLKAKGIVNPVRDDVYLTYETRVLEEIEQRQRLVLIQENKILKKALVIIDFGAIDRPEDMLQTYQLVQSILLDKYGNPTSVTSRGELTQTFFQDVRDGKFVRSNDWERPGGKLRFCIPKRLDGMVRLSIEFAVSFPPPAEMWDDATFR
ncbi:MAG: hypothetical protein WC883_08185 [Smithellaceae bacterium]|jgi:hypothetical protein